MILRTDNVIFVVNLINRFEKQNYAMFAKFMTADASIDVDALEYVEGPMESLHGSSAIFRCGLCLVCTSGKCTVSTGASTYNNVSSTNLCLTILS